MAEEKAEAERKAKEEQEKRELEERKEQINEELRVQSVEAKIKAITRALNLDFDSSDEILALLKK